MFTKIVSYARFSDPSQSRGTSIQRQLGDQAEYIAQTEGLSDLPLKIIKDEGTSAFHGANRIDGELGRFEMEAMNGEHAGTLFLCEKYDRLSRQGHEETQGLIRNLIKNGVTVHLVKTRHRYRAGEKVSLEQIITAAVACELAEQESQNKADRVAAAWDIKRIKARRDGTVVSKVLEPWLYVGKDRKAQVIEDRAALVRRWFEMADSGMGALTIAKTMGREEIEPWTRKWGKQPKIWNRSFISSILANRAVIGEYQPMNATKVAGKTVRVPDGEPWIGHFPAIISHDVFARVNAMASSRKRAAGGRKGVLTNLLAGLCKCSECGATMEYRRGKRAGTNWTSPDDGRVMVTKRDSGQMTCPIAQSASGKCGNKAWWSYLALEDGVLDTLLHLAMDDSQFSSKSELGRLANLIAERERELVVGKAKARKCWERWTLDDSDSLLELAQDTDRANKAIEANLAALRTQRDEASGRATSEEHLRRVADIRANLYADDLDERFALRRKVAVALNSLIAEIVMSDTDAKLSLIKGAGFVFFDRKGKPKSKLDLLKRGRGGGDLADYERRREEALKAGEFTLMGRQGAA